MTSRRIRDAVSDPAFDDAAYIEEVADGDLDRAEMLYGTIPFYRDGWAHIHPQDQALWLDSFVELRAAFGSLERWRDEGQLTRSQAERIGTLLLLKIQLDPILAELRAASGRPAPDRAAHDDFDLL